MQGNILGQTGGLDINGIIEEYKVMSGGNVSAGDFVKFVNKIGETTVINNEKLKEITNGYDCINAVILKDKTVFVAYSCSANVYGMVCKISDTDISIICDSVISTEVASSGLTCQALNDKKIIIAYSNGDNILKACICNFQNNSITSGIPTVVKNATCFYPSMLVIDENRVCIFYKYFISTNYYLYGVICKIEEDMINVGTDTNIAKLGTQSHKHCCDAFLVNSEQIVLIYAISDLYASVINISNMTMSTASTTQLTSSGRIWDYCYPVQLSQNKFFIAHSYYKTTSSEHYLQACICIIDASNSITKYNSVDIEGSYEEAAEEVSVVGMDENTVFMAYNNESGLSSKICDISEMGIESRIEILLSNLKASSLSSVLVNGGINLYYETSSLALNGMIVDTGIEQKIDTLNSLEEEIEGVAKTSGSEGEMVQVFVPNFEESEES